MKGTKVINILKYEVLYYIKIQTELPCKVTQTLYTITTQLFRFNGVYNFRQCILSGDSISQSV